MGKLVTNAQYKTKISQTLLANGLPDDKRTVAKVWQNYMCQCGYDTDVCDALAATFGGSMEDYVGAVC